MSSRDQSLQREEPSVIRDTLAAPDRNVTSSASHDAAVLARMRTASQHIRSRRADLLHVRGRGLWMISLAASFALGVGLTFGLQRTLITGTSSEALWIPAQEVVRGDARVGRIPVEQADPAAWYRYIQELIYAGEHEEALAHLRRFNDLHPDYILDP
ncbi:MAG: hypothetical protein ACREV5_06695 [Steroidobacter sp.]